MRAAEARRSASIINSNSMSASLTLLPVGVLQIDCITKTSEPRTFSPISTRVSAFRNSVTSALPTWSFKRLAISSASCGLEFPLKMSGGFWLKAVLPGASSSGALKFTRAVWGTSERVAVPPWVFSLAASLESPPSRSKRSVHGLTRRFPDFLGWSIVCEAPGRAGMTFSTIPYGRATS